MNKKISFIFLKEFISFIEYNFDIIDFIFEINNCFLLANLLKFYSFDRNYSPLYQ